MPRESGDARGRYSIAGNVRAAKPTWWEMAGAEQDETTCRELVELVTDYLEGRLPERDRMRFDAHLDECGHCDEYLGQMRRTIELLGELPAEEIDPARAEELLAAFRGWRRA